jgi:hypothetical protein
MLIEFVKEWSGPYGVFPKGRKVDLGPTMLAAVPKDFYRVCEEAAPADAEITDTRKDHNKKGQPDVTEDANTGKIQGADAGLSDRTYRASGAGTRRAKRGASRAADTSGQEPEPTKEDTAIA